MQLAKTDTLKVPGANLHWEVRGSGPVLLLICGGVCDAAGYAGRAQQLADRYTVVPSDRRGNSRSPLDGRRSPRASGSTATTHTACCQRWASRGTSPPTSSATAPVP